MLPKNHQEFKEKEYWDSFFKKRGKRAFEWYGEYGELCGILHKYIKPTDQILHIGCGNSTISADLFDVGYKNQYNIGNNDYFDYLIKQFRIDTCGESQVNELLNLTSVDFTIFFTCIILIFSFLQMLML